MQNWEVLQKKISEMNKDDFIIFAKDQLCCAVLRKMLGINIECIEYDKYIKETEICKKELLEEEYKEPKQEKWIVHRTLRKSNKEIYLVDYFCKSDEVICVNGIAYYFSYDKNKAYKFKDENVAIQVRDKLNTLRVGKRYLWVISKVEE